MSFTSKSSSLISLLILASCSFKHAKNPKKTLDNIHIDSSNTQVRAAAYDETHNKIYIATELNGESTDNNFQSGISVYNEEDASLKSMYLYQTDIKSYKIKDLVYNAVNGRIYTCNELNKPSSSTSTTETDSNIAEFSIEKDGTLRLLRFLIVPTNGDESSPKNNSCEKIAISRDGSLFFTNKRIKTSSQYQSIIVYKVITSNALFKAEPYLSIGDIQDIKKEGSETTIKNGANALSFDNKDNLYLSFQYKTTATEAPRIYYVGYRYNNGVMHPNLDDQHYYTLTPQTTNFTNPVNLSYYSYNKAFYSLQYNKSTDADSCTLTMLKKDISSYETSYKLSTYVIYNSPVKTSIKCYGSLVVPNKNSAYVFKSEPDKLPYYVYKIDLFLY